MNIAAAACDFETDSCGWLETVNADGFTWIRSSRSSLPLPFQKQTPPWDHTYNHSEGKIPVSNFATKNIFILYVRPLLNEWGIGMHDMHVLCLFFFFCIGTWNGTSLPVLFLTGHFMFILRNSSSISQIAQLQSPRFSQAASGCTMTFWYEVWFFRFTEVHDCQWIDNVLS